MFYMAMNSTIWVLFLSNRMSGTKRNNNNKKAQQNRKKKKIKHFFPEREQRLRIEKLNTDFCM